MTRQTTEPLESFRFQAQARCASEIVGTMWQYLDMNPPYQRGSVWTLDQRIALVKSWMMGVVVPTIVVNNRATAGWRKANGRDVAEDARPMMYGVVDGKQRIETARLWFGGELAVPSSWFPADEVVSTVDTDDGPYATFNGLTRSGQLFCKRDYQLPMIETSVPTVEAEAELYLLVNGAGTAQSADDMANAARVAGR